MKKTLGVIFALSLVVIFATGCSNSQVIPVKSNCNKMQGKVAASSHCKLVNRKGHQYIVQESNGFSFKTPSRWGRDFRYIESDRSEKGVTDYTLTLQYAPLKEKATKSPLRNFMVLKVLDRNQWPDLEKSEPTHQLLAETDNLVYVVQFPEQNPYGSNNQRAAQFKKMSIDLDEVKANFKLIP